MDGASVERRVGRKALSSAVQASRVVEPGVELKERPRVEDMLGPGEVGGV
jgi:hypothetical protein